MSSFEEILYMLQDKMETPVAWGWFHLMCIGISALILILLCLICLANIALTLEIITALNLLENAQDDGIYRTSSGAIGINASAIKSGSLEIISSESTSPVFSANIADKKVTLGGFTVKYGSFYSAEPGTSAAGYDHSVIKVVSNDSNGAGGNGGLFFYPSNTAGYASRAHVGFSGSGITVSYKSYTGNPEDSVKTFTLADLYFALHLGSGMSNFKSKGKTGWVGYLIDESWGRKTKEFLLFINGVCVSMTQEDVAKAIEEGRFAYVRQTHDSTL